MQDFEAPQAKLERLLPLGWMQMVQEPLEDLDRLKPDSVSAVQVVLDIPACLSDKSMSTTACASYLHHLVACRALCDTHEQRQFYATAISHALHAIDTSARQCN